MFFKSSSGVSRGFSRTVYWFRHPTMYPINEKHFKKFILIQILRDKIFIAIVSKHFKKRNFMICLFFKESNWNCFHVMFQPDYASNFALGLACVLYIVIGFDAPLAWNYQPKEHLRVLKILSEWKYGTFSGGPCTHNQTFRLPIS